MTADLRAAVLAYVGAGWPVFPCDRVTKAPLKVVRHGFKDATLDEATADAWWRRCPGALIGTALPTSMFVVDVDNKNGVAGDETLRGLEAEYGKLPTTLTCHTHRGRHLYFAYPTTTESKLRQGASILGPGLDTRMPGKGYVILPPSPHPDGGCYRWADPTVPIAAPPGWLVEKLRPQKQQLDHTALDNTRQAGSGRRGHQQGTSKRYVERAIVDECSELSVTPDGQRNDRLYRAAWALSRFVQTGDAEQRGVEQALTIAALASGLEELEITSTIHSAFRARGVVVG